MNEREKEKITRLVLEQFGFSHSYRKEYESEWGDHQHAFYCKRRSDSARPYRSNVYLPLIYDNIECVANHLYRYTFAMRPFFGIRLRDEEEGKVTNYQREVLEQTVLYQLDNADVEPLAQALCRWTPLYGTTGLKIAWGRQSKVRAEQKKPPETETMFDFANYADASQEVRIRDGVVLSFLSPYDIFPDPSATSIYDAAFLGIRILNLKSQFRMKYEAKLYPLLTKKQFQEIMTKEPAEEGPGKGELGETRFGIPELPSEVKKTKVEILEWYFSYDADGDGEDEEYIATIINRKYLARFQVNTYGRKPFAIHKYIPDPHSFYGISLARPLYGIQAAVNTLLNQRIDNISLALNKIFIVNPMAILDPNQVVSRPGQRIITRGDMDALRELPISDVTTSSQYMIQYLTDYADKATGVTNYFRGAGGKSSTTLGEVEKMLERSAAKYIMPIRHFHYGIKEMIGQVVSLTLKYMPGEVVERLFDREAREQFERIPRDNIDTLFDYEIYGTNQVGDDAAQLRRLLEIMTNLRQMPEFAGHLNYPEFLRRIMVRAGLERPEELISEVAPAEGAQEGEATQMPPAGETPQMPVPGEER